VLAGRAPTSAADNTTAPVLPFTLDTGASKSISSNCSSIAARASPTAFASAGVPDLVRVVSTSMVAAVVSPAGPCGPLGPSSPI